MIDKPKPSEQSKKMSNGGTWTRILIPFITLAALGLVTWGALNRDVAHIVKTQTVIVPKVFKNCEDIAVLRVQLYEINKKLDKVLDKLDK